MPVIYFQHFSWHKYILAKPCISSINCFYFVGARKLPCKSTLTHVGRKYSCAGRSKAALMHKPGWLCAWCVKKGKFSKRAYNNHCGSHCSNKSNFGVHFVVLALVQLSWAQAFLTLQASDSTRRKHELAKAATTIPTTPLAAPTIQELAAQEAAFCDF